MQQQRVSRPLSLVSIAASTDATLLAAWETHLLPLQQAGHITFWSKRRLSAGAAHKEQVLAHLDQASCIIFLLSSDFFADEACLLSLHHALQRKQTQQVMIVPLLVRPATWQETEIGVFPCLPSNERPVSLWTDRDDAFQSCVQELCSLLHLPARTLQRVTPPRAHADTNRERMLRRLRLRYEQMLAQSLQGAVQIELGLASRPAAIEHAASLALRLPDQPEFLLPPHTSIIQAYERAQQELLILGEPGAGKSTLLLELAHHLMEQAEIDAIQPLPIVLPLSSWATKRPALQEWLVDQVALLYDVPRKLSQQWVQAEMVLPLLDGLDEMEETARAGCIATINTYHRERLCSLVVCSRTAEYDRATGQERLALQTAVVVLPLSAEQADAYLHHLGKPQAALRDALSKNRALQELATTPLLLQVLMLTYHGTIVGDLSQKENQLRQQVWADYVRRMVSRKGNKKRYSWAITLSWLSWLARQMQIHNQTIFFLERLQPDWLLARKRVFYLWSIILAVVLLVVLLFVLLGWLLFELLGGQPIVVLLFVLLGWLLFVQLIILRNFLPKGIRSVEVLSWSAKGMRKGLAYGLFFALLFAIVGGFDGPVAALIAALLGGPLFALFIILIFGMNQTQLTERLLLTPNEGMRRSIKYGLSTTLLFALLWGLLGTLLFGLIFGPTGGLVGGLVFGLLFAPTTAALLFGEQEQKKHTTLQFFGYCRYAWNEAATCSKRSVVRCSLTPMYLL